MTTHEDIRVLYEHACPRFLKETGEEPVVLAVPTPCTHGHDRCEHDLLVALVPSSGLHMLPEAAMRLSLHCPQGVEFVALASPMLYFQTTDPADVENLEHGDLQVAYENGDERVREVVCTMICTADSLTSQTWTQPLMEPMHDEPLPGGEGDLQDALRRFYEVSNA